MNCSLKNFLKKVSVYLYTSANKHQLKMQSNAIICTVCNKTFTTKGNLDVHSKIHTPCKICGMVCYSTPEMKKHMLERHGEETVRSSRSIYESFIPSSSLSNKGFSFHQGYGHQGRPHSNHHQQGLHIYQNPIYQHQSYQHQQPIQHHQPIQQHQPIQYHQPIHQQYPIQYHQPIQQQQPIQCHQPIQHHQSIQHQHPIHQQQPIQYHQPIQQQQPIQYHQPIQQNHPIQHNHHIQHQQQQIFNPQQTLQNPTSTQSIFCEDCRKDIPKKSLFSHVRTTVHKNNVKKFLDENVNVIKSIYKNRIATFECENNKNVIFPEEFLNEKKKYITKLLQSSLIEHTTIKFNLELVGAYIKPLNGNAVPSTSNEAQNQLRTRVNLKEKCTDNAIMTINHATKMRLLTLSDDIEKVLNEQFDDIRSKLSEFQERDSGHSLAKILKLEININQAKLTRGSNYIETPKTLGHKKACLNIKNQEDNFCFKWCLIAAIGKEDNENGLFSNINMCRVPTEHRNRTSAYTDINIQNESFAFANGKTLSFKDMEFPVALQKIQCFEKNNPNISVNVFGYENNEVVGPYYITKTEKENHVNLMLLHKDDRFHYILIENMSRYV